MTSISEAKKICDQLGLSPSKNRGQSFLLDKSVAERMVRAANVAASDTVVEVGPGLGLLTLALLNTNARIIAIELDTKLTAYLSSRLGERENLILINQEVLKFLTSGQLWPLAPAGYKLVANLPYNITSLVLRAFLTAPLKPRLMMVMVQKEVAERICSQPGQMNLLALSVQYYGEPQILELVPAEKFWPQPAVDSAVLKINLKSVLPEPNLEKMIFRLARMAFAGKRKQLHKTLSSGLNWPSEQTKELLVQAGLDPTSRPQMLSVEDWMRLGHSPYEGVG